MIKIRHIDNHIYEATNGKDIIVIDPKKYTPIDFFITGLANCSAYDVVELAKNKGFEIKNFTLEVEYKRRDTYPKIFTEFHFIYKFDSSADDMSAKRWVLSSLETYCSTINTIRNTSKIFYTIIHNGETIAFKEYIISGDTNHQHDDFEDDDFSCVA
jgi:putative redox protein